jgi:hypothetical protein
LGIHFAGDIICRLVSNLMRVRILPQPFAYLRLDRKIFPSLSLGFYVAARLSICCGAAVRNKSEMPSRFFSWQGWPRQKQRVIAQLVHSHNHIGGARSAV